MDPTASLPIHPPGETSNSPPKTSSDSREKIIEKIGFLGILLETVIHKKTVSAGKPPSSKAAKLNTGERKDAGDRLESSIDTVLQRLKDLKHTSPSHKIQCKELKKQFLLFHEEIHGKEISLDNELHLQRLVSETEQLIKEISKTPHESDLPGSRSKEKSSSGEKVCEDGEKMGGRKRKKSFDETQGSSTHTEEPSSSTTSTSQKRRPIEKTGGIKSKPTKKQRVLKGIKLSHAISFTTAASPGRLSNRTIHQITRQQRGGVKRRAPVPERTDSVALSAISPPAQETQFETILKQPFPSTSKTVLYHVVGDPIGAHDADLEGYHQIDGWKWLASAYDAVAAGGDPAFKQKILEQKTMLLEGARLYQSIEKANEQTLPTIARQFQTTLENLSDGKAFIFPGGWAEIPGHAMVYEFKKSEQHPGKYTFFIHNVGTGIQYHPQEQFAGQDLVSCLVIDDIDLTKLSSPVFIRYLSEFTVSKAIHTLSLDDQELYQAVFSFLGGETRTVQIPPFSETQRSGTCVFASYFAFLKNNLSSEEYERFELALGLKTLMHFVKTTRNFSETDVALVEKSLGVSGIPSKLPRHLDSVFLPQKLLYIL